MNTMTSFLDALNPPYFFMYEKYLELAVLNEPVIRLTVFIFVFITIGLFEIWMPKRKLFFNQKARWSQNIGIALLNIAVVRLLFPFAAVGIATYVENHSIGILPFTSSPSAIAVICGFLMLDMCIYWQHRLFHRVPALWRLHMIHHTDPDLDLSTGLRFHPLEMVLSMMIKTLAIIIIGPPVIAVLIFEIVLNGSALFTHGNFTIPTIVELFLRKIIVTPDMHRIHHSVLREETDSNFSFSICIWDHLFKTYRTKPKSNHKTMLLGLTEYRNLGQLTLINLLIMPFRSPEKFRTKGTR